jgi:hypothetical protein
MLRPLLLATIALAASAAEPLRTGSTFTVSGRQHTIIRLDTPSFVDSDYTRRFKFDVRDNPKLKRLREMYKLDEVVAKGKEEFERQILLLDWVHTRFKKFGKPSSKARGALDILQAIDQGHTFFCAQYADVMVSAAASMGWVCRDLALRRPDYIGSGSTEHSSTEIWSNQHRKWIMFDPTFAMYVEKDGVPLNAYELRHEWFNREGRDLVFVVGAQQKRYRKSDMPIVRARFEGFGDLSIDPSCLNVYAFIGYIPNTNFMDAGLDYGKMFITQDKICDGTKWHKRTVPQNPASDPYFPINQATVTLIAEADGLRVELKTMTPNFKTYMARIDEGEWKAVGDSFVWPIKGAARLEVKTVNHFGVDGPVSIVEVK